MPNLGSGELGSGLAQDAMILEQFRPAYLQMAQDALAQNQEPPPFEQWAAQQHAQSQTPRRSLIQALMSRISGQ